jgi:phage tail-like protein
VADHYRRYPGDRVRFYIRLHVWQAVAVCNLQVTVPAGMEVESCQAPAARCHDLPRFVFDDGATIAFWELVGPFAPGEELEYQVQAQVAPTSQDAALEARAKVTWGELERRRTRSEHSASIAVAASGRYARYLPAIYQADELTGRLMMLFESFWAPIEQQIDSLALYFDPKITPAPLLPWLASWLNLALDEHLAEARQRRLVERAVPLYRRRGSRHGLTEYLEILTGGQVHVMEHRAHNLRLGADARLGPGIALGTLNRPHTFTVTVYLPPAAAPAGGPEEQARQEMERRRALEAIIEAEKPAHTDFNLRIEEAEVTP